ncbi:MAG: sigma-70 family RNA polymerase sigma factor [Pirellulales bacterium]|nr:sigma-70 family RNA polymerase sigma factor [Pirellulales bacterium]
MQVFFYSVAQGQGRMGMRSGECSDASGHDNEGDHQRFVKLYSENSRRIYRYILTLTVNHADAEEVFQATSLVLWKKFSEFDSSGGAFHAWAFRVAAFEVLHLKRSRRSKHHPMMLSDEVVEMLATEVEKRSDELDLRESALKKCLAELPARDRRLIDLRYADLQSPKEIAQLLGRPSHIVYRSLTRIHGVLRRCVARKLAQEL